MDEFEKEIKESFLEEFGDLLLSNEGHFLELERRKNDPEILGAIFRFAHNLKGTSRAVGFGQVAELTHRAENLILKLKENQLEVNDGIVSLLLEINDRLRLMLDNYKCNLDASFDNSQLENKIEGFLNGSQANTGASSLPHVDDLDNGTEAREETKEESALSFHNFHQIEGQDRPYPGGKERKREEKVKAKEDESIRVPLSRIERLNNFVGEMVILQTLLQQRRFVYIQDALANKSISQLSKICKEIQDISMSLRMIPLRSTFQMMSRIVRDTSKTLNKKVTLTLKGEDTEIDKTVIEHLSDPLVHIVRNAIDHGLEYPDERVAAGKNEEGRLELRAYHEGSRLIIEVEDDGKGINPEVIRKKAVEKGIIPEDANLPESEIIKLIFHMGFSTRDQVTEVSGRGVGMDVVKTNIENLSGEISIQSQVGKGSVFRIVLPLTLAIIDGMIVRCDQEKFIIPMVQVGEFVRPDRQSVHFVTGLGQCLQLRGKVIPIFDLKKTLRMGGREKDGGRVEDRIAVIIRTTEKVFAVQVDDILGQQQVVIKKIGEEIKDTKGIMGSSILGDGKCSFILDLNELYLDQLNHLRTQ